ncbi:laminin subunit alpha-3 isoform X1 [Paramisgurnus dabryanus]|uniref:laminin subunit alpha-3 isoform X1 n=1 Tax=Paramisgurnus dabryanus TaxID=90735 RepID=UPI0031F3BDB1
MMCHFCMVWIGSLALITVDLWVSADNLGTLHKSLWDNDVQVKNNSGEPKHRLLKTYCESANIKGCDAGHYRERRGPNKGLCVPCKCNRLSDECDPHTGKCLNCQFNTAGDHCERCMEGYYGNAVLRTCSMCPCPFTNPSNSFALGCLRTGDEFECLCKPGYSGSRCERCALGYYGNPLAERGSCQPCNCDHAYVCDSATGDCYEADDPDPENCLDCDDCVVLLMDQLETMDIEFSFLKTQLEPVSMKAAAIAALKKLEDAIAGTKVLVDKYAKSVDLLKLKTEEFEADIESFKDDLTALNDKAIQASCSAIQLLKTLDKTYQRGKNLHSEIVNLLQKIHNFLDQLKNSNHTGWETEEATRMLKEARRMLEEMRRQKCKVKREIANEELEKAKKLFNFILNNFMTSLNGSSVKTDRIGQNLMDLAAGIRDIQEALIDAKLDVVKANDVNDDSEALLENILKHLKILEKEQGNIKANVNMTRRTLKDTSDLQHTMKDLTTELSQLAAEVDGARHNLERPNTSKEAIVRRAEEHAQDLMNLAMDFQMAILNVTNSSAVHNAIQTIKAFTDVTIAIREAEAAANRSKEAADRALKDVQGQDLKTKANILKNLSNALLVDAKDAKKSLQDVTEKCERYKDMIQRAEDKQNLLRQAMKDEARKLNNITRDDISANINQAKEEAFNVNGTASDALARIHNISEELNKTKISPHDSNLNKLLDDVNKTLAELDQSFPSLIDKLKDVQNQSKHASVPANMSSNIQRIKEMIEKTRDMANRVRGPIFFSGDAYVELRPPKDIEDLRSFTALNLTMHRPEVQSFRGDETLEEKGDLFVLYLGNKHTFEDYIGLVLKNDVLFCVYKLGGIVHEIKTSNITRSNKDKSFMDRVDFRRVYQDAQVIFTQFFTSAKPKELPPMTNQAKTMVGLLNLDPSDVVFYVGGYPTEFTPPKELQYPGYKGCIEFSTLNDRILGLYNFQRAVNITSEDKCLRGNVQKEGYYFDGTGYGIVNVLSRSTNIRFKVLSHQVDAVLFYMGHESSYYLVTMEGGYIVLQGANNDKIIYEKSDGKVSLQPNNMLIRIFLDKNETAIEIKSQVIIYLGNVKGLFKEAYIGGVPTEVREKYNVVLSPLKGCIEQVQVNIAVNFKEEVGIIPGCQNTLLGIREATFKPGGSMDVPQTVEDTDSGLMISFGFKTGFKDYDDLIYNGMNNTFLISLNDSFVKMTDGKNTLKSRNKNEIGKWHYVTAYKNSSGMQFIVDNTNTGDPLSMPSFLPSQQNKFVLGRGALDGCLRNLYIRSLQSDYIPVDFSGLIKEGDVSVGSCKAERPPLNITKKSARHAKVTSKINQGLSIQACRNPRSIKRTYHLGVSSQLQFKIDSEKLNNRPQFSLDVQTKSFHGLIIHITGKQGAPVVFLYLTNGNVKLSVGGEEIVSSHKINDGDWHNIKFGLKRNSFYLAVDGITAPDKELLKGSTHDLQSPVYVGHRQQQIIYKTHGKALSQKSMIGCIRDFRFSKVLLSEPSVNYGAAPCFKGMTAKGAYFAGDGAHVVLEKYLHLGSTFDLAFEFWPRNQTGLLFHKIDLHGRTLTLFLKRGKVVVKVNDGRRRYGTTVTPTGSLCASFHYVAVSVRQRTIKLRVDAVTSRVKGPTISPPLAREIIYIGGISENSRKGVEKQTSYVGCLRNLRLNNGALSFEEMTSVFGPINMNECPAE